MVTYNTVMNSPTFHDALEAERPRIVRLCRYWLGDAVSAEDAAQEVLIEAWRHIDHLRHPAAFQAWIAGMARNVCARWRRKQGRMMVHLDPTPLEPEVGDVPADTPELTVALEQEELAILLDRALALLPNDARTLLIQKYLEAQSNDGIAAYLGANPNGTAVRLHRGKVALRKILTTHFAEESATMGLIQPSDLWQKTTIWCPNCGRERLMGKWNHEEFLLRCPTCHAAPGLYQAQSGTTDILDGVKGYRPALTRFTTWMNQYLGSAIPNGMVTCRRCQRPTPLRQGFPAYAPSALEGIRGIHVLCEQCDAGSYESLDDFVLGLPEGQAFFRAHPRIHVLPQMEIDHNGTDAIVVRHASVTAHATYDVIVDRATYEILTIEKGVS